jgi:hypothetical protein
MKLLIQLDGTKQNTVCPTLSHLQKAPTVKNTLFHESFPSQPTFNFMEGCPHLLRSNQFIPIQAKKQQN